MLDLTTDLYDNPVIIDPATGYLKLDHTKRSTFVTCPAKYNYNWNLGIKPEKGSTALRFGIVWHDVIAAFFGHIAEHGWTRDGGALHAAVEVAQASWQEETEKQEFWEDYRTLENLMLMLIASLLILWMDTILRYWISEEYCFNISGKFSSGGFGVTTRAVAVPSYGCLK